MSPLIEPGGEELPLAGLEELALGSGDELSPPVGDGDGDTLGLGESDWAGADEMGELDTDGAGAVEPDGFLGVRADVQSGWLLEPGELPAERTGPAPRPDVLDVPEAPPPLRGVVPPPPLTGEFELLVEKRLCGESNAA